MKNPLLVPEFREMLASGDIDKIKEFCFSTPPAVVADFISPLSSTENKTILMSIEPELRSEIFSYFDNDVKLPILELLEKEDEVNLISGMLNEKRIDFFKSLSRENLLNLYDEALNSSDIKAELAQELEQFLKSDVPAVKEMTPEEIALEVQPLVQVYKYEDSKIVPSRRINGDCWVNITNPSKDDLPILARYFKIPMDFLTASLDIDETARIETEDDMTLIILKAPYFDEHNLDVPYITLPIGIIITGGPIITVCARKETILRDFIEGRVKNVVNVSGMKFILQLIYRATMVYLQYLKQINNVANMIQKKLEQESKNEQLIKLLNIEKSLVYFTTSLKTNAVMLERLQRISAVHLNDEMENLFDDIVIENRQALEMSNIYSDILSGMMDAFASIISNNLNIVMKVLTAITIILMIPNILTGFFGMNLKLPFQDLPLAFLIVIGLSMTVALVLILYFIKKKWL